MISAGRCALVLGSSGGLGSAMVSEFLNDPEIDKVFAVSSKKNPFGSNEGQNQSKLVWLRAEYSETESVYVQNGSSRVRKTLTRSVVNGSVQINRWIRLCCSVMIAERS